jgi:hypothetical protein
MTETEAKAMIADLAKWLVDGAPGNTKDEPYENAAADLAREFCDILLDAADAQGLCGCRLCQN